MYIVLFAAVALALALIPIKFRKVGFATVGVVVLVFLAVVGFYRQRPAAGSVAAPGLQTPAAPVSRRFDFDQYERDRRDKEDPEAKTRISLSELRFDQIAAVPGLEPGTIRSVRARLYNESRHYALSNYAYYLRIQDCLAAKPSEPSGEHCTTVYDQKDDVALTIPAGQARDVEFNVPTERGNQPSPFKLLGTARVELTVGDARAYQTPDAVP